MFHSSIGKNKNSSWLELAEKTLFENLILVYILYFHFQKNLLTTKWEDLTSG